MRDKAIHNYAKYMLNYAIYKIQFDNAVDTCSFIFDSVSDWYKTQQICDKSVSNDSKVIQRLGLSNKITIANHTRLKIG